MSDERDPLLESLFAKAAQEPLLVPSDDSFNADVMAGVEKRRRNVLAVRVAIVAMLFAFELLMSSPMQNSVGVLTSALDTTLFEVNDGWLATVTAPLNSVAGLVGALLLGVHSLYRRVLH